MTEKTPKRPYIDARGALIIAPTMFKKYHWWAKGQSVSMTLIELGVDEKVWARYSAWPYMDCAEFHTHQDQVAED
jgi:hypothetical protein